MAKRKALGKGLGALIRDVAPDSHKDRLIEVDISEISPNPSQPRTVFDDKALAELAASIKNQGILQPLVLRREGAGYQIIVGERRWRASQKAGLKKVPAIVHDSDDDQMLEFALVENIQRQDLNPLEEARAYQLMVDRLEITQEEVARRVGKDRSTVTNMLRLLKLHDDVKNRLIEGRIEMGHARALLALPDAIAQRELCEETIRRGLTVRQVESRVKELKSGKTVQKKKAKRDPFIKDAEERLSGSLQSRVSIKPGKQGGKIEIRYASDEDLQRLFDRLIDAS